MKVGDLVRMADDHFSVSEKDWVGVIVDFNVHVDKYGDPRDRYAVVCWNSDFPQEEEYPSALEVVNEGR